MTNTYPHMESHNTCLLTGTMPPLPGTETCALTTSFQCAFARLCADNYSPSTKNELSWSTIRETEIKLKTRMLDIPHVQWNVPERLMLKSWASNKEADSELKDIPIPLLSYTSSSVPHKPCQKLNTPKGVRPEGRPTHTSLYHKVKNHEQQRISIITSDAIPGLRSLKILLEKSATRNWL